MQRGKEGGGEEERKRGENVAERERGGEKKTHQRGWENGANQFVARAFASVGSSILGILCVVTVLHCIICQ